MNRFNQQNKDVIQRLFGWSKITIKQEITKEFMEHASIPIENMFDSFEKMPPLNWYFIADCLGVEILCKRENDSIKRIKKQKPVFGISARNTQQAFALDALLDRSVELVTLSGDAGCGKSILALAAGADLVFEEKCYEKIVIIRPTTPLGKGIGFLPGTIDEKLAPWTAPITDAFNVIFSKTDGNKTKKSNKRQQAEQQSNSALSYFIDRGQIEMDAMAFIRGRSIGNSYIVVDEAQNLTRHEIKTIITRAGEGSKVVVTGDPSQSDIDGLTEKTCGLTILAEAFLNESIAAHVELIIGERSKLATLGSKLL